MFTLFVCLVTGHTSFASIFQYLMYIISVKFKEMLSLKRLKEQNSSFVTGCLPWWGILGTVIQQKAKLPKNCSWKSYCTSFV